MSFVQANFNPVGGQSRRGKAPVVYTYWTTDSIATCDTSGYFDDVANMLSVGDVIDVVVVDSVTAPTAVTATGRLIIKSNASGVVDTYDGMQPDVVLTAYIADVSTAGQIYVVSPVAGAVKKIYTALNGAIGTADAVITPKIGGNAITNGAITIAYSGSAAGDVDSSTPTAANTVTAGQAIEIETDGASSNTIAVMVTIVITPIADSD